MRKMQARGCSLLESVMAVYLVVMAFAVVMAVYPLTAVSPVPSANHILASSTAHNIFESIRAVPWGSPMPDELKEKQVVTYTVDGEDRAVEFVVTRLEFDPSGETGDGPEPDSHICRVTLTIQWNNDNDPTGESPRESLTLSRVMMRREN